MKRKHQTKQDGLKKVQVNAGGGLQFGYSSYHVESIGCNPRLCNVYQIDVVRLLHEAGTVNNQCHTVIDASSVASSLQPSMSVVFSSLPAQCCSSNQYSPIDAESMKDQAVVSPSENLCFDTGSTHC